MTVTVFKAGSGKSFHLQAYPKLSGLSAEQVEIIGKLELTISGDAFKHVLRSSESSGLSLPDYVASVYTRVCDRLSDQIYADFIQPPAASVPPDLGLDVE